MSKKKTHDEFVAELYAINKNIEVIGVYINNCTKIACKCIIDGNEWDAIPTNLLKGKGCPICGKVNLKTHEQYLKDVAVINPNIDVIGKYINSRTKILHQCKVDGYEWYVHPNSILSGTRCPICSGKLKTTEIFKSELLTITKNIEVVGDYVNSQTKIHCICMIDGHEWDALPVNLLKGVGCPVCSGTKHKTNLEYIDDVAKIDKNIEVVGVYVNARTKILHRCKIDGTEWLADPHHILAGQGCPVCSVSRGEKEIRDCLLDLKIGFKPQYTFEECRNKNKLPFDFYIPKYNICIEYDGEQHFKPIERFGGIDAFVQRQINDSIKNKFCESNNISLLRIRYDQDVKTILYSFFNKLTIQN